MPRILIVVAEFAIAVALIVVLNTYDGGSITTDDTMRCLDRGATWSVYAFLVTLGLIFVRRRYLWIEVVIVALLLPVTVWALTPDPGPNIGKGFTVALVPGIMIGAAVSLLYKTGSLLLTWTENRKAKSSPPPVT